LTCARASGEDAPVRDAPRFLARHSQYAYTEDPAKALPAEPEAINAEAQELLTLRAQRTAREVRLVQWRERREAVARELDWLYSQRLRRDVRTQLRAVQRQLDRLDQKIAAG
jgi:hypothetical protein